jgi:tetratricopeptide (TPR) repeat protein
LLPYLALAQLELGEVDQAGAIAGEAVRLATEQHERLRLVDALRVQGMVLTRVGQSGEAAGILEEGLELARSLPFPYAEGRILYQLGLLDQERGQYQQARQHLEEAQKFFHRLGARKDMGRTEQALVELATI